MLKCLHVCYVILSLSSKYFILWRRQLKPIREIILKTIAQYKSFNYCGKIPLQQKYLLYYYGSLRNEYLSHFILKGEFYLAWRRIICHGCKVESKYFEGRCDTCFSTFKSGQQTQVFLTLTLRPEASQEAMLFDTWSIFVWLFPRNENIFEIYSIHFCL